jgi:diguanylate cyclase (GGDEF)-like protein
MVSLLDLARGESARVHASVAANGLVQHEVLRAQELRVWMLFIGHVLGAAFFLLVPSAGENRMLCGLLLIGAVMPLLLAVFIRGGAAGLMEWAPVIDLFAVVLLLHVAPNFLAIGAILVVVLIIPTASSSAMRWNALVGASLLGLASVVFLHRPVAGFGVLAVLGITLPGIRRNSRFANRREAVLADNLEQLIVGTGAAFWAIDTESGKFLSAFGQLHHLTGLNTTDVVGESGVERIHPEDRRLYDPNLLLSLPPGQSRNHVVRVRRSTGGYVSLRESSHLEVGELGSPVLRGVWLDVSEMSETQDALTRYLDIVQSLRSAVLLVGRLGGGATSPLGVVEANEAVRSILDTEPDSIVGLRLEQALPWTGVRGLVRDANQVAAGNLPSVSLSRVSIGNHRFHRLVDVDVLGLPGGLVALIIDDVTDSVTSERTIRHQAEHDSLTGLANRALFNSSLATALEERGSRPVGVLLLDLNRFKEVNDTLGHAAGDALLKVVAERIEGVAGSEVLVARLGGDEFALLITRNAGLGAVVSLAEKVGEACREPVSLGELTVPVSASIGVVLAPLHGDEAGALMRRADIAMYDAKRTLMGHRVYEDSGERDLASRLSLTSELGEAFENDQIELWFQSKVDLATGEVAGVEGLVRWRHPARGLLSPNDFLELIELAGYRQRLNRLVLEQGIRFGANCLRAGRRVTVAVNLSALSFYEMDLPQSVFELLGRYGLPANNLLLEVTEQDLMEDVDSGSTVTRALGDMGVLLSIDDFGTGYSSLSRLRELPVSELKIDRSFVADLPGDRDDEVIVRSIIDLASNLGLRAVAEGVETLETAEYLASIGCDVAQGYYFSKALEPAEALAKVLAGTRATAQPEEVASVLASVPAPAPAPLPDPSLPPEPADVRPPGDTNRGGLAVSAEALERLLASVDGLGSAEHGGEPPSSSETTFAP